MTRKRRITGVVAAMALAMSMVPLMALPAAAASQPEVVATGLNSPYKLTEGPNGAIYVAEAGTGGDICATVVGPEGDEVEACSGATGSITRIAGGSQTRVVTGLASVALGEETLGPMAVSFDSLARMHVVLGLGGSAESRDLLGLPSLGTLLRIPDMGDPVMVADLVEFEEENDPDEGPGGPDSNPFALTFIGTDALVADAGGNTLLRVTSDGTTTVEAVFPPTMVDPPPFLPIPGQIPMESVPTGVAVDDGTILVGNLTGFPFVVGAANVSAVSGGTATAVHTGFTNIVDIAVADDGTLYVLEFASNGLLSPDGPQAALVQVRTDGTRKTLLYGSELPVPTGVTVASDGMVYLSVCTLCGPGQGMVWKIDPSVAGDPQTASACDPADVPGTGFGDIASSTSHREAIECAAWWGVVNGFSPTVFGPSLNLTREQAASVILRTVMAADIALILGAPDAFTDDDGSPHEMDINLLAATGVIQGRGGDIFDPLGNVTRAEMASLVARAYTLVTGDALPAGPNAFTDDEGSVHEADINAVAAAGWVNGVGGGLFNPNGHATRAQVASILTRMLSTFVDEGVATLPAN
jgi:hypothetical protein